MRWKHVFKIDIWKKSLLLRIWILRWRRKDIRKARRVLDEVYAEVEQSYTPNYCNRNKEITKLFNQKYVISFEKPSVYAFRQCGHQCVCEVFWTNLNIELLKYVVCRT